MGEIATLLRSPWRALAKPERATEGKTLHSKPFAGGPQDGRVRSP